MIVPINLDAADRMLDEWLDADDQRRFATANWQLIRSNYAAILDAARAGVVAEEPEWEYRIAVGGEHEWPFGPRDEEQGAPLEEVQTALGGQHGDPMSGDIERRAKAIPAGPWVPVMQEGTDDV